jgi:hypothetical protein
MSGERRYCSKRRALSCFVARLGGAIHGVCAFLGAELICSPVLP